LRWTGNRAEWVGQIPTGSSPTAIKTPTGSTEGGYTAAESSQVAKSGPGSDSSGGTASEATTGVGSGHTAVGSHYVAALLVVQE
jgi:hypothetical protein